MKKIDIIVLAALTPVLLVGAVLVALGAIIKMVGWLCLMNHEHAAAEIDEIIS